MKDLLAVGAGGALGAVSRYLVYVSATKLFGLNFPYGTVIVNIAGSFLLGILIEVMAQSWGASTQTRLFLVVGFLGAFTTFSTFSLDTVVLYERKQFLLTAIYVLGSVACSIAALFAGMAVARFFFVSHGS